MCFIKEGHTILFFIYILSYSEGALCHCKFEVIRKLISYIVTVYNDRACHLVYKHVLRLVSCYTYAPRGNLD